MTRCRVFHFVLEDKEKDERYGIESFGQLFSFTPHRPLNGGGGASSSTLVVIVGDGGGGQIRHSRGIHKKKSFIRKKGLMFWSYLSAPQIKRRYSRKSQEKTRRKLFISQLPIGSPQSNARVGFSLDLIGYKCPADYTSFAGEAKWSRRGGETGIIGGGDRGQGGGEGRGGGGKFSRWRRNVLPRQHLSLVHYPSVYWNQN